MNPVLRDSLEAFFGDGHGLPPYFYLLAVLAPVEFLALCTPFLGAQMWTGAGNLFMVSSSVALLMAVYFAVRVANREYAPSRFRPLEYWLRDRRQPAGVVARGQVAFLAVHAAGGVLLVAPLLAWAAAIAHVPAGGLAATLALLPFYALCYGVWGLAALALWEHEQENRELIVRFFVGFMLLVPMAVFVPLNPVVYVVAIAGQHEPAPLGLAGAQWSAGPAHFIFHVLLGGGGLAVHRWALGRRR